MHKTLFSAFTLAIALAAASGCTGQTEDTDTAIGELTLLHDEAGLHGTFVVDDVRSVKFNSKVTGDQMSVVFELNPLLTIETRANRATREIEFIVPDGALLTLEDSRNLNLFHQALLAEFGTGELGDPEVTGLVNLAGIWAEKAIGVLATVRTTVPRSQSVESLCHEVYGWSRADHDCNYYGWGGDPKWVSMGNYSYNPNNYDGTSYAYWSNGWQYPNQYSGYNSRPTNVPYEWGLCFGECGAGCGSPDYSRDCLNHDHCVRNHGHSLASLYCDDQFASTADDALPEWLGGADLCW